MGIFYSTQSPKDIREQAKSYRTDVGPLDDIRMSISEAGNAVTFKPSKGKLSSEKHVYAGDLSTESAAAIAQMRPLLTLEFRRSQHCAVVKNGNTGDVIMLLVKEYNDEPWYGDNEKPFKCTFGGATESRLYANGRPVGVSFRKDYLNVAPPTQVNGEERPQVGASMEELLKVRQSPSLVFVQRKKDGSAGQEMAVYSRAGSGSACLKFLDASLVDPVALAVMAWFVNLDERGGV